MPILPGSRASMAPAALSAATFWAADMAGSIEELERLRESEAVAVQVADELGQALRSFAEQMGGTSRRGLLFEGTPGTGKTYVAKAMAAEAAGIELLVEGWVPIERELNGTPGLYVMRSRSTLISWATLAGTAASFRIAISPGRCKRCWEVAPTYDRP